MITNIDFASLYGVAQALTLNEPFGWAKASYYDVALTILLKDDVRVPPPPDAAQTYRPIISPIQERFGTHTRFTVAHKMAAMRHSQEIGQGGVAALREALMGWFESSEYLRWVNWHFEYEMCAHIENLMSKHEEDKDPSALVEVKRIPLISQILKLDTAEVRQLNLEAARNPSRMCSKPTNRHKRIYAVDAILRGLYYDRLAELSGRQIVLHPIRRIVERHGKSARGGHPVASHLGAMVGNWARGQKLDPEQTVRIWADMLCSCRNGRYGFRAWLDAQSPNPASSRVPGEDGKVGQDDTYRSIAITIAKENGIRKPLKWLEPVGLILSHALPMGAGIAVEMYGAIQGLPEAERLMAKAGIEFGTKLVTDAALKRTIKTVGGSRWAIGKLAERSRLFSGRVFSYEEATVRSA